jgi:uncharacterized damage-inducible protein DinB
MASDKHDAFLAAWRWQARHNAQFNARLYDACERLDDAARRQERGAFFGSIHRTLNHLLVADHIWLVRLRQCARDGGWDPAALDETVLDLPQPMSLDHVPHARWEALRDHRARIDAGIEGWVADMPPDFPGWTMRYANTKGVARAHPAWQAVTHLFHHQTHHRGQVTTLLMQAGVDPGVTDLIATPVD